MRKTHGRTAAVAIEVIGATVAIAMAVIALARLSGTERALLLYFNGDSLLLPLVARSVASGEPFEWVMSSNLFFVPEIPIYLAIDLITRTVKDGLIVNAVLNVVLLYLGFRMVARAVAPRATRLRHAAASLLPLAVVIACMASESSGNANDFQPASHFLMTSYYYGSILAMVVAIALCVTILRTDAWRKRADRRSIAVLTLIATVCTTSNPLFVAWMAAPAALTAVVLAILRRIGWAAASVVVSILGFATVLGLALRVPLQPFIAVIGISPFQPSMARESARFYIEAVAARAMTPPGAVEFLLVALLLVGSIATVFAGLGRRDPGLIFLGAFGVIATLSTVGFVILGTFAPRYFMVIFFAPALSSVGALSVARLKRRSAARPAARWIAVVAPAAVVITVAVPASVRVAEVSIEPYEPAACLSTWSEGKDVTGAGQFFAGRPLEAYGSDSVYLQQIDPALGAFAWLTNMAEYGSGDLSYVIVDSQSPWVEPLETTLGQPADVVDCSTFQIWDYRDTPGERVLTALVDRSSSALNRRQGFDR